MRLRHLPNRWAPRERASPSWPSPGARAAIQAVIDDVNQRFARIEQIKRFVILPRDLTQEAGELTPTLKVKRNIVYRDHAELFDALYEGAAAE